MDIKAANVPAEILTFALRMGRDIPNRLCTVLALE